MIILGITQHYKLGKIELGDWVKKEEEIKGQQGFM